MWMRVTALSAVIVLMLSAQTARSADSTAVTIRLISETTKAGQLVDRAPEGVNSKGDVRWLTYELRNAVAQFGRRKGAIVGHETVLFKWLGGKRVDISVRSDLPGGRLLGGGIVQLGPQMTYRITDGRGRFKNATGTGESVAIGAKGHQRRLLYQLVLG